MFGVKRSDEAHEVGGARVEIILDEENELKGARVYFTASEDGKLIARTPVQVGFRPAGAAETTWLLESELTAERVLPFAGSPNMTIGGDETDYARVEQKLRDIGLSREETMWIRPDDSQILTETAVRVNYQLDPEAFRTVAKIAFNYFACQTDSDFVLSPEFDAFRRFVRYGEGEYGDFVTMNASPLLHEEKRYGGKQTRGHLLAVEWHPRQAAPTGSVKLFNDIHYHVKFADHMNRLWREIRSGHHFDITDMTIDKMSVIWWSPLLP